MLQNKAEVAINMLKVRESDAELKLRQVLDEMEENRANPYPLLLLRV